MRTRTVDQGEDALGCHGAEQARQITPEASAKERLEARMFFSEREKAHGLLAFCLTALLAQRRKRKTAV
jgi:hypothetical protein